MQQSRINLDTAFKNFFDNIRGKNNSNANYPKFKSKKDKQSYREVKNIGFNTENRKWSNNGENKTYNTMKIYKECGDKNPEVIEL